MGMHPRFKQVPRIPLPALSSRFYLHLVDSVPTPVLVFGYDILRMVASYSHSIYLG